MRLLPAPERHRPASANPAQLSPLLGIAPKSPAAAATASSTCVQFATRAGWANNGYFAGDLVTAAAICVAESTGDPKLYVCDNAAGQVVGHGDFGPGKPVTCPAGTVSYDRGLWQLNTAVPGAVSDTCAFDPVCNAKTAYLASGRGTSFAPWSSYDQDVYTSFIDPAQTAVTHLTAGTVTSALLGECMPGDLEGRREGRHRQLRRRRDRPAVGDQRRQAAVRIAVRDDLVRLGVQPRHRAAPVRGAEDPAVVGHGPL